MNLRYVFGFFAFVLALAICGRLLAPADAARPQNNEPAVTRAPGSSPDRLETSQPNAKAAYDKETQERVAALAKVEEDRRLRSEAAKNTASMHQRLLSSHNSEWAKFVAMHREAFMELRQQAEHAANKQAHCTICDGTGALSFCILCQHSGKCVTCGGTGRMQTGEYCPTCGGTGKCFLCAGSGKMNCPFCDDGVIDIRKPISPSLTALH